MTITINNLNAIQVVDIGKDIFEQNYVLEQYDNWESIFHSIKIENFEQLEWLFRQHKKLYQEYAFIFRGQKNCHWVPISSLERLCKDYGLCLGDAIEQHYENFQSLARGKIAEQFLLKKSQMLEDIHELWAVGQHLGLKTPLLDWTHSLFVALYFAFEDKDNKDNQKNEIEYRSLYCLNSGYLDVGEMYVGEVVEPVSDPYGRLTAQQGLFLTPRAIFNIRNHFKTLAKEEKIKIARKYLISNQLRSEIMDYLAYIGLKKETVYPDIAGVVMKCNDDLVDLLEQRSLSKNKRQQKETL
ncbi:FRG domain-containing protein [Pasteurellaceae bacterium TAE3-ERU1]|nr:FRG domain-containing protein [Pasteurellaceae bacterium TAE3-ERU1]